MNNKMMTVARQEFLMMARTKVYLITTILGPFLVAAVMIIPGLLSYRSMTDDAEVRLAIYSEEAGLAEEVASQFEDPYSVTVADGREDLDLMLEEERADGALLLRSDFFESCRASYVSVTGTDIQNSGHIEEVLEDFVLKRNLSDAGLNEELYKTLASDIDVGISRLDGDREGGMDSYAVTLVVAMVVVMMLYMTIYLYGFSIGRSVVRERTSNTVDILLSSARPIELMGGKLLGLGAAGLLQMAVWIGIILAAVAYGGSRFPDLPLELLTPGRVVFIFPYFILGFLLYGSAFLAIGSFSETDQQLQQAGIPLLIIIIIPMVSMSGLVADPEALLMRVLNQIPFSSPLTMPVRIIIGAPAAWEVALSLVLLLGTLLAMVWLSGRIFRVGILLRGKSFKLKEVIAATFGGDSRGK